MEAWKHTFYLGIYKYVELVMQPAGIRKIISSVVGFFILSKKSGRKQKLTGKGGFQGGKSCSAGIFL
jgi:hypothetical protein